MGAKPHTKCTAGTRNISQRDKHLPEVSRGTDNKYTATMYGLPPNPLLTMALQPGLHVPPLSNAHILLWARGPTPESLPHAA